MLAMNRDALCAVFIYSLIGSKYVAFFFKKKDEKRKEKSRKIAQLFPIYTRRL